MVTQTIYTEFSPRLESILGRSWRRMMGVGLGLALAGLVVLSLPRLIVGLIALGLFILAGITLTTAYRLWQLHKSEETIVDVE